MLATLWSIIVNIYGHQPWLYKLLILYLELIPNLLICVLTLYHMNQVIIEVSEESASKD